MSLQDDIFDVETALKRKPNELKMFNKIITHLSNVEEELENNIRKVKILKEAIRIVKVKE